MQRARVHTTTVRFDADTWAEIGAESERLGIARAEYIRGAVLRLLGHNATTDHIARLEHRLDTFAAQLARIATVLHRLLARSAG
jgi:hypothetical protein